MRVCIQLGYFLDSSLVKRNTTWVPVMATKHLHLQPVITIPHKRHLTNISNLSNRLLPFQSGHKRALILRPHSYPTNTNSNRCIKVRSQLNLPLISPNDQWGNWTSLFAIGAFGIWYLTRLLTFKLTLSQTFSVKSIFIFFFTCISSKSNFKINGM